MKAFKKNAKNAQAIETQDLAQALADWYNNLACKIEFAVQSRDDQCPKVPSFRAATPTDYQGNAVWDKTVNKDASGHEPLYKKTSGENLNDCVAQFMYVP